MGTKSLVVGEGHRQEVRKPKQKKNLMALVQYWKYEYELIVLRIDE